MNFDLDENQELFRATVERFCGPGDISARHAARRLPGAVDRTRWSQLAELGVIGLAAPEADGGLGGSLLDCAVVAQALGKGQAVEPWLECGFIPARLLAGSEDIAGVLAGQRLATLAFAEPRRRYTLDAVTTKVSKNRLNGEKTFVLCGGAAELLIVSAEQDGSTQLFAVPHDAAGIEVRPYPVADGTMAAIITLRDVVVGIPLKVQLGQVIDDARIMAAAEMTGLAQRLFDDTLAYVKTREQFGQPLGRFQVIQHRLVDAYAKLEAMQSAVWRALLVPGSEAAAVKGFVAEEATWVAQQAVQLHGGMGMTDELGIGHGLKRILLLSRLFGDPAAGIAAAARAA